MLLHKIEAWDTIELLHVFSQFSDVEVFKPVKKHAIRSSFYLIAKNVRPGTEGGRAAIASWKKAWWNATFGGKDGVGAPRTEDDDKYVKEVIDSFGSKFTKLAKPVWEIQLNALRKTDFV